MELEEAIKKERKNIDMLTIKNIVICLSFCQDSESLSKLPDRIRKTFALNLLELFCQDSEKLDPTDIRSEETRLITKIAGSSIEELIKYFGIKNWKDYLNR